MSENSQDLNLEYMLGQDIMPDEGGELIPLISPEEEKELSDADVPGVLPILPVRNTVLFPGVVMPITVGRKKSVKLVKDANAGEKIIAIVAQNNPNTEDPNFEDLYKVGTVAKIVKSLVLPDGNTTIIIQGKSRFQLDGLVESDPYLTGAVQGLKETFPEKGSESEQGLKGALKDIAEKIISLNPDLPPEAKVALDNIETLSFMTHFLSSNLNVSVKDKQLLLEVPEGEQRATRLLEYMNKELQLLEIKSEINSKVHVDIDAQQRDYFLRQQMKVLQDELGEEGPDKEIEALRLKAEKKEWPDAVRTHFEKELKKISRMNPAAADYPVTLNYAEFLVDLPWGEITEDNFDLKRAKKVLDQEHYGLEKVKKRILEYLAVLKLKNVIKGENDGRMRGPILCLYGPPGVGKTSLGKSIAKALGRNYVRMALGGVRDEAEIRGHRKTYIGAMAGKVISNIDKAGSSNPVFVLDEIDKVASDFKGDPSSALLEVLDPEQNSAFVDNYLEVEYDLSKVLFIATCNSLDTIQPALRDRMEIIDLSGYTLEEKSEIAKRHLVPKQMEENAIDKDEVKISKAAILKMVEGYTRESGVRSLERVVGSVMRYVAKSIALEEEYSKEIKPEHLSDILGSAIFDKDTYDGNDVAGIVTGLAWTSVGGEILNIEALLSKGKGKLTLSGQLGDVMKESALAALSNLRAHADDYGIDHKVFDQYDLHVHVPAGAVPKDGPSAGITMYTALASAFTQRKVKSKIAMTGEVTLSGKVLPVGGIKEKILAAKRAGIKEIIMCHKNKKDIDDIKDTYLKGLTIHYVKQVHEVIDLALLKTKVKNAYPLTIEENNKK